MAATDERRTLFTRRALLRAGVGVGAGALLLGGGAYAALSSGPPAAGNAVLSAEEAAFLRALAEVYLPPGNALGIDAGALDIVESFDAHLAQLPPREQRVLRGLLAIFDQWPRLSFSARARFSSLPLEERVASLRSWEESKRQARHGLVSLLRVVVGLHLFSSDAALAAVGHRYGCGRMA